MPIRVTLNNIYIGRRCGVANYGQEFVIGGREAAAHKYPWQVSDIETRQEEKERSKIFRQSCLIFGRENPCVELAL